MVGELEGLHSGQPPSTLPSALNGCTSPPPPPPRNKTGAEDPGPEKGSCSHIQVQSRPWEFDFLGGVCDWPCLGFEVVHSSPIPGKESKTSRWPQDGSVGTHSSVSMGWSSGE